jgi:hypothetical protein
MKPFVGEVRAPRVVAADLISGWGDGIEALPDDAAARAEGRPVIPARRPPLSGDRFRRSTRECLLGVAAVERMMGEAGLARADLSGNRTALLYATASAYAASNRAFIEGTGTTTLYFPYTAPSVVPAEVAIEYGISGPYVIFLGGAPATLSALWYAAVLLASRACDRALVLAVETFEECADLYARGRWLPGRPLVEAAACVLLEPGAGRLSYGEGPTRRASADCSAVARRLGEAFACTPLVELGVARATRREPLTLTLAGAWRGRRAVLSWNATEAA